MVDLYLVEGLIWAGRCLMIYPVELAAPPFPHGETEFVSWGDDYPLHQQDGAAAALVTRFATGGHLYFFDCAIVQASSSLQHA